MIRYVVFHEVVVKKYVVEIKTMILKLHLLVLITIVITINGMTRKGIRVMKRC